MGKIIKKLNQYVSKYLNTRVIFAIDMVVSLLASLLAVFVLIARYISTAEWLYLVLATAFLFIFIVKRFY